MDRDHLTHLVDDPARVQRDDIADLKVMAERYPWFSGAHLLLAVGGHREGDVLFDEQLRASAAHLPSRSVLYDKLHAPSAPASPAALHVARDPVVLSEPFAPAPLAPVEPTIEALAIPEEPTIVEPVAPAPLPVPEPEITPAAEYEPTPWKERLLHGDRDEQELDRQMRDSAVAISYELLLEREGSLGPVPQDTSEQPVPIKPAVVEPVAHVPQPVVDTPQATQVRARSFSDWLSQEQVPPPHQAPGRSSMAKPVEDPEIIRAVQQLPPIEPKHSPETAETKALVERFIKQNAESTPPKKAEFFNPQTAAKRSLEEHADLVTETLAKIYEKQGNIAKAIAAYERLAVKHPERSVHFRALAKALAGR